jgi:hypothetical protein
MAGKNHFGSNKGSPELHGAVNTNRHGTPHAYSLIVDVAVSPSLGAKTILFTLDGLYCARRAAKTLSPSRAYSVGAANPHRELRPLNSRPLIPYSNCCLRPQLSEPTPTFSRQL